MKSTFLRVLSSVLFPIAFIALFFMWGGSEHGVTCWLGFSFILFSYAATVAIPLLLPKSNSAYIFGLTSARFTIVYFIINLLVGIIFILADFNAWKIALTIEIIILVAFGILFSQLMLSDQNTATKEMRQKAFASDVKKLAIKAKMIMDRTADFETKKTVQRVYTEINSCPINSSPEIIALDESISYNLDLLNQAVMANNSAEISEMVSIIISLVRERKELSNNS